MLLSLNLPALAQAEGNTKKQGGLIVQRQVATYMSYTQMAQQLVSTFPDSNSLVMDHAKGLVAGEPVKEWKNCVLQDTLQAHFDAQAQRPTYRAAE